jgi:hypothetical protein
MLLVNVRPFGRFAPGDTVEVPDGAVFDHAYFKVWSVLDEPTKDEAPSGAKEVSE